MAAMADAERAAVGHASKELQDDAGLSMPDFEVLVHLTGWPRAGSGLPIWPGVLVGAEPSLPPRDPHGVVVAVPAEGLHGGRAGAGPLRHGAAGRAPGGDAVRVRAPVPARAAPLGPALGVVLPRLAAAVGRHVEQAEGPVDRLVATARRGVGEEHAVAVAQEAGDVPLMLPPIGASTPRTEYQGWV